MQQKTNKHPTRHRRSSRRVCRPMTPHHYCQVSTASRARHMPLTPFPQPAISPGFSTPTDPLFNITFDPAYPFGSEAANLEYSILSAILNQQPDNNSNPSLDPAALTNPSPTVANGVDGSSPGVLHPSEPWGGLPQTLGMHYAQAQSQLPLQGNGNAAPTNGADSRSFVRTTESHPLPFNAGSGMQRQGSQLALPSPPASEPSTGTGEIVKPRATSQVGTSSAGWAYSDGVKKYDYTEGYHFLMSYLHDRCVHSSRRTVNLLLIVGVGAIFYSGGGCLYMG